jgi:hypothetical protein
MKKIDVGDSVWVKGYETEWEVLNIEGENFCVNSTAYGFYLWVALEQVKYIRSPKALTPAE